MINLQAFRDDIRKQISDKISKNYTFLDVSSPKAPADLRTVLTTKNNSTTTPMKTSSQRVEATTSTKSAQKKFFDLKDFSKKPERTTPARDGNKSSELLSHLNRLKDGQRLSVNQNLKNSYVSRSPINRSPTRGSPSRREM